MIVKIEGNVCYVTREPGDRRYRKGGRGSAESNFLHHVKQELQKQGHDVIKKRMYKDGHLVDDYQQYIRTRGPSSPKPHIYVSWGQSAIRDAADVFNTEGEVELVVHHEVFEAHFFERFNKACAVELKKRGEEILIDTDYLRGLFQDGLTPREAVTRALESRKVKPCADVPA